MAAAKPYKFSYTANEGNPGDIEVRATVVVRGPKQYIEGWLKYAPECAEDHDLRVLSIEAEEQT